MIPDGLSAIRRYSGIFDISVEDGKRFGYCGMPLAAGLNWRCLGKHPRPWHYIPEHFAACYELRKQLAWNSLFFVKRNLLHQITQAILSNHLGVHREHRWHDMFFEYDFIVLQFKIITGVFLFELIP